VEGGNEMRRLWHVVGTLVISFPLAGCGDGSGESTATPDNLGAAAEAAKKMQLREAAAKEKQKLESLGTNPEVSKSARKTGDR
jgi:hypothetical protein